MNIEEFTEIIRKRFHISYLRPYQTLIISHIIENRESGKKSNILASLPTGSGKSLCFMAPILLSEGITIIIYPLLSLMADQEKRLKECNIESAVFKGGLKQEERIALYNKLNSKEVSVIITNVEMLLFLVSTKEICYIKRKVETVVFDEVHTLIEWGESFRPSFLNIGDILKTIMPTNILAFSATIDGERGKKIIALIFSRVTPYIVHSSSDRENIFYSSIRTLSLEKDIVSILKHREMRPSLIFCKSREKTSLIARMLERNGFDAKYYHAKLEKEEKKKIEEWFYSSKDGVLSSTIAFGMGVDKNDIRSTIHTYIPHNASSFLQESGRGGRDGSLSYAFVLYSDLDTSPIKYVFTNSDCIRSSLLKEMDEEVENKRCLMCSKCVENIIEAKGEREIVSLLKYYGIMTKKALIRALYFPIILRRDYRLKGWKEDEIEKAIETLQGEETIVTKGPFLALSKTAFHQLKTKSYKHN